MSQSSISQQVRALEEEFAVLLLDRDGPRLSLTPVGQRLYRLAFPMVEGMDLLPDMFADLHYGVVSGELHIAAGEATAQSVLPEYVKRFLALYPAIEVHVRTGAGDERLRWLRTYEVDLVLGASDSPQPDLVFRFLFASEYVIITPEDHPLAGRESITVKEACSHPGVLLPRASPIRRLMDLYARQHGTAISAAVEVGGWDMIKRHVEAGSGIAVVPEICLTEQDRLWRIPMTGMILARRYGVLVRRDPIMAPACRRFIRSMEPDFPEEA